MTDRLRVLVVDDNRDSLLLLERLIGKSDCDVRTCADSKKAVHFAQEHEPHVIFLDIAMPDLDGFEVAEDLHHLKLRDYLLVAVTSYSDEAHRRECEASGFNAFLAKPPSVNEVSAIVFAAKQRFCMTI
jgi:CheY-like chemotaxis protein